MGRRRPAIAVSLLACSGALLVHPSAALSRHLARTDPTEPIFTQRAFVEKNVELDTSWSRTPGSQHGRVGARTRRS
jgi:hypothetical protein